MDERNATKLGVIYLDRILFKSFLSRQCSYMNFLNLIIDLFIKLQRLRAGTVWVNDYNVLSNQVPFGGYKQSGIGRENGPYGINNYTEVKAVITKLKEKTT